MASPRKTRRTSSITNDSDTPNDEVATLEDAKTIIRELKDRGRTQSQQLLAWRRRLRHQEEQNAQADSARASQLSQLSSQLLLLEARLLRKRRDIDILLGERDATIARQARALAILQVRLTEAGLDGTIEFDVDADSPLDSLNDSDSAVVLEDDSITSRSLSRGSPRCVSRSISDALDTSGKHNSRRSNGFLRRPEILETVYSVEEDADGDAPTSAGSAPALCGGMDSSPIAASTPTSRPPSAKRASWTSSRSPALCGSIDRSDVPSAGTLGAALRRSDPGGMELLTDPPPPLNTYNRVMSNHRSVTKPKDVKYKRINKAKSKSLEELRGRLKNWVDKGHRSVLNFEHSEA